MIGSNLKDPHLILKLNDNFHKSGLAENEQTGGNHSLSDNLSIEEINNFKFELNKKRVLKIESENDSDESEIDEENEDSIKDEEEEKVVQTVAVHRERDTDCDTTETTAERLGRLAITSFLKPSSKDNIFNAFFKSTYLKDSWVHYSLT